MNIVEVVTQSRPNGVMKGILIFVLWGTQLQMKKYVGDARVIHGNDTGATLW